MADKPKNEFPKVPPFVIPGASEHYEEPESLSAHMVQPPRTPVKNNTNLSSLGIFSSLILVISVTSIGVALISGAWFAYSVLNSEPENEAQISPQVGQHQNNTPLGTTNNLVEPVPNIDRNNVLSKVIVVGLAFLVGWIFSAFGIRVLGNFWLPYAIQVYAWVVLGGIIILQVLIMSRLYQQEYHFSNYIKYLSLFGAGMIALVGLHLMLEEHSLRPFGVLILLTSLGHLYSIVYHYIFVTEVVHEKVWGDLIFFLVTTAVSLLMLAHFGMLNGFRSFMDRKFTPKDNPFVPPE